MKRIITSLIAALLVSTGLFAQQTELCSQHHRMLELEKEHPGFLAEVEKNQQRNIALAKKIAQRPSEKSGQYTIPVVFHIISEPDNPRANVTDAQIYEAVELTNLNFAGLNPEISRVVPEFQDRIGLLNDIQIKIATIDPNGNCTNGINRYKQVLNNGGTDTEFKQNRQWPTDQYLNLYIVPKIASGAAGYSNYPNNAPWFPATDGVVLLYNYLGSTGESNFNRSFTLAHEIGHYLDLPHVWGNSNSNDVPSNCNVDDGIDDTPLTQGSADCSDVLRETCGSLDNVQNFMDYSYCSFMFTEGQGDRMRAALESSTAGRNNLWSPENLELTGVDYDGETPDFLCTADFEVSGISEICPGEEVSFIDRSFFGVSSWEWSFEGGQPATSTEASPVVTYNSPGTYPVTLTVTKGGQTETITKENVVRVLSEAYEAPFEELFTDVEILTSETGKYSIVNPVGDRTWEHFEGAGYDDNSSIRIRSRFVSNNSKDELISAPIDLGELQEPTLAFAYGHALRQTSNSGSIAVSVSTDCGENFTVIKLLSSRTLNTAGSPVPSTEFVPSGSDQWDQTTIDLSSYVGQQIQLKIAYQHGGGNNIYLDNLRIQEASSVGVVEKSFAKNLMLWPNPNKGTLNMGNFGNETIESIKIFDIVGKQVSFTSQNTGTAKNVQVTLSKNVPGIYVVHVQGSQGSSAVLKFSVTK